MIYVSWGYTTYQYIFALYDHVIVVGSWNPNNQRELIENYNFNITKPSKSYAKSIGWLMNLRKPDPTQKHSFYISIYGLTPLTDEWK